MESVTVSPAAALRGEARVPGDKSVTHRAYLMAALAEGDCRVRGANPGEDCLRTLAMVEALGVQVLTRGEEVVLRGAAGRLQEPGDVLDCGNSGTTLRLGAGVIAGQRFLAVLSGDASLRRRPVERVAEPLGRMGATVWARDGGRRPPLVIRGGRLRPLRHQSGVASAQVKSCVLLAGLYARGRTEVHEPLASRDHTEIMLAALKVPVSVREGRDGARVVSVRGPARPRGGRIEVPGDNSSAAFLMVAAALSPQAEVRLRGVGLNPTRAGLHPVLISMGASIEVRPAPRPAGEPRGDLVVAGGTALRGVRIAADQVPALIDEIPVWAVAAAAAEGVSELRGAGELRVKESDRLAMLARNLRAIGAQVEERRDGLRIHGGRLRGGRVESGGDHRIAMAFAVAGLAAERPVTVRGIESVRTSYPGFFEELARLGARLEFHEG